MEEDVVFASEGIRNTISRITDATETTTRAGMSFKMIGKRLPFINGLASRSLRSREIPAATKDVGEEVRLDFETSSDDVESEQVTIDTLACHGESGQVVVIFTSFTKELGTSGVVTRGIFHSLDEGARFLGGRADSFSTAVAVETSHGRFVSLSELTLITVVGELESHLSPSVGRALGLLDDTLTVVGVTLTDLVNISDGFTGASKRVSHGLAEFFSDVEGNADGVDDGEVSVLELFNFLGGGLDGTIFLIVTLDGFVGEDSVVDVGDNGGISPRVFTVHAKMTIASDTEGEGLVTPPGATISAEEEFGESIGVSSVDVIFGEEIDAEGGAFNQIETLARSGVTLDDVSADGSPSGAVVGSQSGKIALRRTILFFLANGINGFDDALEGSFELER